MKWPISRSYLISWLNGTHARTVFSLAHCSNPSDHLSPVFLPVRSKRQCSVNTQWAWAVVWLMHSRPNTPKCVCSFSQSPRAADLRSTIFPSTLPTFPVKEVNHSAFLDCLVPTRLPNTRKEDFSQPFSQTLPGIRFTSCSLLIHVWPGLEFTYSLAH